MERVIFGLRFCGYFSWSILVARRREQGSATPVLVGIFFVGTLCLFLSFSLCVKRIKCWFGFAPSCFRGPPLSWWAALLVGACSSSFCWLVLGAVLVGFLCLRSWSLSCVSFSLSFSLPWLLSSWALLLWAIGLLVSCLLCVRWLLLLMRCVTENFVYRSLWPVDSALAVLTRNHHVLRLLQTLWSSVVQDNKQRTTQRLST